MGARLVFFFVGIALVVFPPQVNGKYCLTNNSCESFCAPAGLTSHCIPFEQKCECLLPTITYCKSDRECPGCGEITFPLLYKNCHKSLTCDIGECVCRVI
ncbi:hypothetical protein O0L34_g46 [Tuta absoluta]|nr:hypothetical protein O0L34_g46 [Tuta absoluta]